MQYLQVKLVAKQDQQWRTQKYLLFRSVSGLVFDWDGRKQHSDVFFRMLLPSRMIKRFCQETMKMGPPKVGTPGKPAAFRGDKLSLLRLEELCTEYSCLLGHFKHHHLKHNSKEISNKAHKKSLRNCQTYGPRQFEYNPLYVMRSC